MNSNKWLWTPARVGNQIAGGLLLMSTSNRAHQVAVAASSEASPVDRRRARRGCHDCARILIGKDPARSADCVCSRPGICHEHRSAIDD